MLRLFRTDSKLPSWLKRLLNVMPFILCVAAYMSLALLLRWQDAHGISCPNPRLVPLPDEIWQSFLTAARPDAEGNIQLLTDILASMQRFGIGLGISALIGGPIGLYCLFPWASEWNDNFLTWLDKNQPLLLFPILAICFGIEETSKIALVVLGVLPGFILEVARMAKKIPKQQLYKAQTLGASENEIVWRVILPQIFPLMLAAISASFKAAFGLVIAAEIMGASEGIGYRIFLAQRMMDMPTILTYVISAMVVMFLLAKLFEWWINSYRWSKQ